MKPILQKEKAEQWYCQLDKWGATLRVRSRESPRLQNRPAHRKIPENKTLANHFPIEAKKTTGTRDVSKSDQEQEVLTVYAFKVASLAKTSLEFSLPSLPTALVGVSRGSGEGGGLSFLATPLPESFPNSGPFQVQPLGYQSSDLRYSGDYPAQLLLLFVPLNTNTQPAQPDLNGSSQREEDGHYQVAEPPQPAGARDRRQRKTISLHCPELRLAFPSPPRWVYAAQASLSFKAHPFFPRRRAARRTSHQRNREPASCLLFSGLARCGASKAYSTGAVTACY